MSRARRWTWQYGQRGRGPGPGQDSGAPWDRGRSSRGDGPGVASEVGGGPGLGNVREARVSFQKRQLAVLSAPEGSNKMEIQKRLLNLAGRLVARWVWHGGCWLWPGGLGGRRRGP